MFLSAILILSLIYGAKSYDPFEGFIRVECYHPKEQPKCKTTKFPEGYPNRSETGLNKAETQFFLFTHDNPDEPEYLHLCGGDLPLDSKFNPACRTEIILPGFVSGICNYAIFREIKNELLKCPRSCRNVILVDWMWGNNFDLLTAKKNIKVVAKQLVIVINKLKEKCNLTADDFILTGHSYGAHMAGLVGQDTDIGTINGLEPAGVLFTEDMDKKERLDPTDAKCVQVIHTNAGQCLIDYFGVNFTCGTFDVWYNDGLKQEACRTDQMNSWLKGDYVYALFSMLPAACSHFEALQYYKASINPGDCQQIGVSGDECKCPKDFYEGKCKDCGVKGYNCLSVGAYACDCYRKKTHTNYYLKTTDHCPYCDSTENAKIMNSDKVKCGTLSPCDDKFQDYSKKKKNCQCKKKN